MNLSDLEVLLHAAELGSVRAAALALGMSRAAARRALQRLEREMGVTLLYRDSTGVDLTQAGRLAVERGQRLMEDASSLKQAARRLDANPSGQLRLIVPVGMERNAFVMGVRTLSTMQTGVCLDVREAEDPLTLLRQSFDLMLFMGAPPETGDWYLRKLINVKVGLFATEAYLRAHGEPTTIEALADHPVLQWRVAAATAGELPGPSGEAIPVRTALVTVNMDLLVDAALGDMGIAFGVVDPPVRLDDGIRRVLPEIETTTALWMLSARPGRMDPRIAELQRNLLALLEQALPL